MKFSRDSLRTAGVGDYETTDLDRRAQDSIRFASVEEADYEQSPPVYRFGVGDRQDPDNWIMTDWMPAGGGRAKGDTDTHLLEKGEKVVLLAEGGELSTAQAIPAGTYTAGDDDPSEKAGAQQAGIWRKKFQNGAEVSYDRNTGEMTLNATGQGKCVISAGGASITLAGGQIIMSAPGGIFEN